MSSDLEKLLEVAAEIDAVGNERVGMATDTRDPKKASGFVAICEKIDLDPGELVDFIREREKLFAQSPWVAHFPTVLMMGITVGVAFERRRAEGAE